MKRPKQKPDFNYGNHLRHQTREKVSIARNRVKKEKANGKSSLFTAVSVHNMRNPYAMIIRVKVKVITFCFISCILVYENVESNDKESVDINLLKFKNKV